MPRGLGEECLSLAGSVKGDGAAGAAATEAGRTDIGTAILCPDTGPAAYEAGKAVPVVAAEPFSRLDAGRPSPPDPRALCNASSADARAAYAEVSVQLLSSMTTRIPNAMVLCLVW